MSLAKEQQSHRWSEEGGVSSFCVSKWPCLGIALSHECFSQSAGDVMASLPATLGFIGSAYIDFKCLWMFMLLFQKVALIDILLGSFKYSTSLTKKYLIIRIMTIIILGSIYRDTSHVPATVLTPLFH